MFFQAISFIGVPQVLCLLDIIGFGYTDVPSCCHCCFDFLEVVGWEGSSNNPPALVSLSPLLADEKGSKLNTSVVAKSPIGEGRQVLRTFRQVNKMQKLQSVHDDLKPLNKWCLPNGLETSRDQVKNIDHDGSMVGLQEKTRPKFSESSDNIFPLYFPQPNSGWVKSKKGYILLQSLKVLQLFIQHTLSY